MTQNQHQEFTISVNYEPKSNRPAIIFRTFSDVIDTFSEIDRDLVSLFAIESKSEYVLEQIELGSIKTKLITIIKSVDDDALKELSIKKLLGSFLVKAKYQFLKFLEGKQEITSIDELELLENQIKELANSYNIQKKLVYNISSYKMLTNISKLSKATLHLKDSESVKYISNYGEVNINNKMNISEKTIDYLLTRELKSYESKVVLQVKKPDFLGKSMWSVSYEGRLVDVKILDYEWLIKFQSREIDIKPGDSIRAYIKVVISYGFDNSIISENIDVIKVYEVLPEDKWTQFDLF